MPGGNSFRQWYAMRQAMRERGTWRGDRPTHRVPQQEEGEPPRQRLRLRENEPPSPDGSPSDPIAGGTPESSTSDSLPELESSPTPEGRTWLILALLFLHGLNLNLH